MSRGVAKYDASGGRIVQRPSVGHYGCSAADRVVKVLPPDDGVRPNWRKTWEVECPGCGEVHKVRPLWREAKPGEVERAEARLPELEEAAA